jgi:hypothetical protein
VLMFMSVSVFMSMSIFMCTVILMFMLMLMCLFYVHARVVCSCVLNMNIKMDIDRNGHKNEHELYEIKNLPLLIRIMLVQNLDSPLVGSPIVFFISDTGI